ncbi:MAG: GTP 3',8-cyclase MoaA [Candidatus Aminicenantales bacterium]
MKNNLIDCFGRQINYLRLSVTDRCNLKCIYCHPPHKIELLRRSEIFTYSELLQIARVASELGIEKIRLTGGELFLRQQIVDLIYHLQKIEGIKQVVLTTNGSFLSQHAKSLKKIGIKKVNVSLDALTPEIYSRITGSSDFLCVLNGIHEAADEGLKVKINMVVLKGINEHEIIKFIDHFVAENSIEVRFIEFMPLCGSGWKREYFFPYERIKEVICKKFELSPLSTPGVAEEFALWQGKDYAGKIGIIAPVTRPFCSSCSRLRISPDGEIRPCLFSNIKVKLLPGLRKKKTEKEKKRFIAAAFRKAVYMKPVSLSREFRANDVYIRTLGG